MVMEAVHAKVMYEDSEREKKDAEEAKRRQFRDTKNPDNFADLNKFR